MTTNWQDGVQWTSIHARQVASFLGDYSFRIEVSLPKGTPEQVLDRLRVTGYGIAEQLDDLIQTVLITSNPDFKQKVDDQVALLSGLFPEPIYVEVIPNQYSPNDPYYLTSPWLIVTTKRGRFKVGSRKKVLSIDWEDTDVWQSAEELFPYEDVTKVDRMIHAWKIEDAKGYIDIILKAPR